MIFHKRETSDRRSGNDRRLFFYDIHIPENRSGIDRRSGTKVTKGTGSEVEATNGVMPRDELEKKNHVD